MGIGAGLHVVCQWGKGAFPSPTNQPAFYGIPDLYEVPKEQIPTWYPVC